LGGWRPEQATLRLQKLPGLSQLGDEAYVQRITDAVTDKEAELRERILAEGRTFMGARAVLRQSPFDRPRTHEPRRELSPRVACRNKWARIEALCRVKSFVEGYRAAWQRYRDGHRDAVFPHGTYWLRVYASVTCSPG
jgi:putative transposase